MQTEQIISEETLWVTGSQAIKSSRWPFKNDKFYKMVKDGHITPIKPHAGARPVYSVAEIDALYGLKDQKQSGGQGGGHTNPSIEKISKNRVLNENSGAGEGTRTPTPRGART